MPAWSNNSDACALLAPSFPSIIVPALIVMLAKPLYSKKLFPDCLTASSQLSNVNVYLISFNPVDELVENVGSLSVFVTDLFAFISPSTVKTMSSVVNVLFFMLVKYLSVAIKSAVTFLFVLSILIFSTFQIGSTTSTSAGSCSVGSFGSPSTMSQQLYVWSPP